MPHNQIMDPSQITFEGLINLSMKFDIKFPVEMPDSREKEKILDW